MPRSVQDILDLAEELAARFEAYEPAKGDERDPKAYEALRAAVVARSAAERAVRDAVSRLAPMGTAGRLSAESWAPQAKRPASATGTSRTCSGRSPRALVAGVLGEVHRADVCVSPHEVVDDHVLGRSYNAASLR